MGFLKKRGKNVGAYKAKSGLQRPSSFEFGARNSSDGIEGIFFLCKGEEKERKAYLNELHAESQRLLRCYASFKPIPVVQKPISSVLEKIRKRKLEISKKAMVVNRSSLAASKADECKDAAKLTAHESDQHQVPPIVEPTPPLRVPVHDTEDLFDDSKPISTTVKQNDR
ncbi:hypothetical protein CASFOL_025223 [Castilleja foliolosa]|uniref:Uncharacterized protein n=1 Tax=Castilleja foliolosa TaxID=1961234 RepID=A0ABD3CT18_9LAMI